MRAILIVTTVSFVATLTMDASASEPQARRPIYSPEQSVSTLELEAFDVPQTIVRERTELTKAAVFHADPQLIDQNAVMVFEISSVFTNLTVTRWRCVAVRDIAECLGRPIKVPYLDRDDKLVMTVTAKRKGSAEARALIEEAHQRDQGTVLTLVDR